MIPGNPELTNGLDESASVAGSLSDRVRSYRPFLVATLAFLFIMQIGVCVLLFPEALRGRPDFRAFYTAGYMVRSGYAHQLFDYDISGQFQNALVSRMDNTLPFYHLPYEALLFIPFSLIGYRSAYIAFFSANLAILLMTFWMARPYLIQLRKIWRWLPVALFVCFAPITIALIQGQDSILLLALATAAFVAFEQGQDFRAGLLVGLALFKFQFALPIFVLFVLWGCWRVVAGFVCAATFVTSVSVLLVGTSTTANYPGYLVSLSTAMRTSAEHQRYGIYPAAMPNLRGTFYVLAEQHVSHAGVQAATILCSTLLLYLVARGRPSFSIAILTSLLVSYHGNIHDAALLVIPIGVFGTVLLGGQIPRHRWTAGLVALIFVLPTLLMLQPPGSYWLLALPVSILLILGTKMPTEAKGGARDSPFARLRIGSASANS